MLLLGVLQAQAAGVVGAGSYDLLETQVLASNQASVTFSSLSTYAADYQHLQIRLLTQSVDTFTTLTSLFMNFNGDSGNNYAWHRLNGDGSSVTSSAAASVDKIQMGDTVPRSNSADVFGAAVIDILDPFNTSKNTTVRALTGANASGESDINLFSGLWLNTSALASISFAVNATTLGADSRFSLYGIRGS